MTTDLEQATTTVGYDVFLSYNGSDRAAVVEIAERLRNAGVSAFLDVQRLVPGEPWQGPSSRPSARAGRVRCSSGPRARRVAERGDAGPP